MQKILVNLLYLMHFYPLFEMHWKYFCTESHKTAEHTILISIVYLGIANLICVPEEYNFKLIYEFLFNEY